MDVIIVMIGGSVGAILRYLLSEIVGFGQGFPLATLMANLLGSFLLGVILTINYRWISDNVKLFLGTGLIGAFTTVSTFSLETLSLIAKGQYGLALVYVLASVLGGLTFAAAGLNLAKFLEGKIR